MREQVLQNKGCEPGARFGRLVVICPVERSKHGHLQVVCLCDCGKHKVVAKTNLSNGSTRSCGCLRREVISRARIKQAQSRQSPTCDCVTNRDPHARMCKPCTKRWRYCRLSPDDYFFLLETQAGLCAICATAMNPVKHTHVDHCHETGRVRGLLCGSCNLMLGHAGDCALCLNVAAAYLEGGASHA